MINDLEFNKICKEDIFCNDFKELKHDNKIEFSKKGIAILYAPNGVGKTSLADVLDNEKGTEFEVVCCGTTYNSDNNPLFYKISDQNGRNVIQGTTKDFLLGDNIAKEFNLKRDIDNEFEEIVKDLVNDLKNEYTISKKEKYLMNIILDENFKEYIDDIVNTRSRGKKINRNEFIKKIRSINRKTIEDFSEDKLHFLIDDFKNKNSILQKICDISENSIDKNNDVKQIEENDQAIEILKKFDYKTECIVCDNPINPDELLNKKVSNRKMVFKSLDTKTKELLKFTANLVKGNDPFNIKTDLLKAIEDGNIEIVNDLKEDINNYINIFNDKISNLFVDSLKGRDLISKCDEYDRMIGIKPKMTQEDLIYIKDVVSENIDKEIDLERDQNNNLIIKLGGKEFINKEREELHLSTGEQNFISLAFEFLKAKNSDKPIIVIDDPISSFDSIYKNKVAYMIIKFLEGKNCIILTHNIDLIRLLDCQFHKCFNLYLFNNVEKERNGFIRVNENEQLILLYLDKLLNLFRTDIFDQIEDEELFLISIIPFMRGYANIIGDTETKDKLNKLMHGYETEDIDVTKIYNKLFGVNDNTIEESHIVSAKYITAINLKDLNSISILKNVNYPLLNRTLKHSLIYLYLRLNVEKTLVNLYSINTKNCDQLGKIIYKAFGDNSNKKNLERRVFLTSRKTLLNEFNHFEGNMNIFQPAIDISDTILENEKNDILKFLANLEK
ncbi:hypothetical protein [Clostridium sp. JN-1]|uniref:hypothetical protein n=1 Tax=Clostridium sp. JN-1 TaxID=2483110 RepID=UPI001A9B309E|nr:hypothetical protein [Clostridium sp. JN-1]